MSERTKSLIEAIGRARAGDWDAAHVIAQAHEGNEQGDWLHAIVHKVEGDAANSRYWYARTPHAYEDYADPHAELDALRQHISD